MWYTHIEVRVDISVSLGKGLVKNRFDSSEEYRLNHTWYSNIFTD